MSKAPRRLLLVPGISSPRQVFDPLARELRARGVEPLTFDFPGRGSGPRGPHDASLEGLSSYVTGILREAGWLEGRFSIAGFSWGSGVAARLALLHRAQVDSLSLIAPVGMRESFPLARLALATPGLGEWIARGWGRGALLKDFLRGFECPENHRGFIAEFERQAGTEAFRLAFLESVRRAGFDFESEYAALGESGLAVGAIASRLDHKLSPRLFPALRAWVPGLRERLLDHGRHMLPLENPAETADFLLDPLPRNA